MTYEEMVARTAKVNQVFTPSAPINSRTLFAGRTKQIQSVLGAVYSRGQHAILYGERGVGKTSLASIIHDLMVLASKDPIQIAKYTCGNTTTFEGMWRSIFKQLTVERDAGTLTLDALLPENPGSEDVLELFQNADVPAVVVIDELDTISHTDTVPILADTIKTLSDHSIEATLVLVGVADSVDGLIEEHQSIERALLQVQMPRMSRTELMEIIDKGLDSSQSDMAIAPELKDDIASLSQGLPTFTHLLTKYAALHAIEGGRTNITAGDLQAAISEAVDKLQQTIKSTYHTATSSSRDNLFKEVLLACALAPIDDLGYFPAGALRAQMKKITGEDYQVPAFAKHLNDFSSSSRGNILEKKGQTRRFRYRFTNPMMQPYVLLRGLAEGRISQDQISSTNVSSPPF